MMNIFPYFIKKQPNNCMEVQIILVLYGSSKETLTIKLREEILHTFLHSILHLNQPFNLSTNISPAN